VSRLPEVGARFLHAGSAMADFEERHEGEERSSPSSAVVYHAICSEGEEELTRPSAALWWSGLAAGLSMGFSFILPALLHSHTPATKWQTLITALGYPIGFLIVVLGRQQLFTENTLTVVLPFLARSRTAKLVNVGRVWLVVLLGNVVGALVLAFVLASTDAVSHETFESMREQAKHVYETPYAVTLLRAIFAGWLIALMVWLLPFAESGRIWVIALLAYVVGVAHFPHIIAGTVDAAFLVFTGEKTVVEMLSRFFVPALLGNIAGGVTLVALINHAQVKAG
jgi:formate/nitrite transporter FocA (FNT family)